MRRRPDRGLWIMLAVYSMLIGGPFFLLYQCQQNCEARRCKPPAKARLVHYAGCICVEEPQ